MDVNTSQSPAPVAPDSPELTAENLGQHAPALRTIGQAVELVRAYEQENAERNKKNARIQAKYDAERPHDPKKLQDEGLGWKNNFSTKPLASLIDKVVPRFTTALRNTRYLTASKLPESYPDAAAKTEFFRRTVTEACRGHEGWDELLCEVAHENSLFGYASLGWLDTTSWFPKVYRQDRMLVARGTRHTSNRCAITCLADEYLLHELFEVISNAEAAKLAGWTVPNVVTSINSAVPDDSRSQETNPERVYADLVREGAVINSFNGAKTVKVWHVLVAEVDGWVTHVAFDNLSGEQLFWKNKQFPSMSDAVAFFSFQHGNGKLQGSKGIGRELYNMAAVLDKSRCEVIDRLTLSGKLVLQCDERDIKRFRMSVVGNAILITNGYTVSQQRIDGNVEPFFTLDRFLTELLDQIAGSTSPTVFSGERTTRAEVEVTTAREEERRDALLERFLLQFARAMSTVQRRLCDSRSIDSTAKEVRRKLLERLTEEEVEYLSKSPAVATIQDYSENERQRIILASAEGRGNPLYNQRELERRSLTAKVDAGFAEAVLLPANDPTEQAENVRLQKMELILLKTGEAVEVSPRDNHLIHLEVLQEAASPILEAVVDSPEVLPVLEFIGQHAASHVELAENAGQKKEVVEYRQWVEELGRSIAKLKEHEAQVQADLVSQGAPAEGAPALSPEQAAAAAPAAPPPEPVRLPTVAEGGSLPTNNQNVTLNYRDMPPSIQRQMESAAGFTPHTETSEELARIELLKKPTPAPKA